MSKELQELRSQNTNASGHSPALPTQSKDTPSSQLTEEDAADDLLLNVSVVSLDGIYLEAGTAALAFQMCVTGRLLEGGLLLRYSRFADMFRPQLPITGALSISRVYHYQPLLFWTIIIIVAWHVRGESHTEILQQFRQPYETFLQRQMLDAPLPLYKIQALILLSEWPLGVDTQTRDPSWLYCGVAIQAARFMSLDRQQTIPSLRSLGVASGSIHARINTWLGLFYVSTSLSMHLGLPPPIDSDLDFSAVQGLIERQKTPSAFATRVKVQLVVAKFTALLTHDLDEATSLSFIRLLDTELKLIKPDDELSQDERRLVEVSILDAHMHFYAMFITKTPHGSTSRSIMLRQALTVAQSIIRLSTSSWRNGISGRFDTSMPETHRCLPKNHYRGFAFAAIFLIRFFYRSKSASAEDKDSVRKHVLLAQEHFKGCSLDAMDEFSRTARLFEILSQSRAEDSESAKLRMNHRMGVSIVLDAVTDATEVRGQPVEVDEDEHPRGSEPLPIGQDYFHAMTDISYPTGHIPTNTEFLRGFWNDPILSVLNFESFSPDGTR